MPPKPSATLTEAELRLMEVLWKQGPSSVQQVLDVLPGGKPLAYNSVLTTIRILEKKGYVSHAKSNDGRAFVYAALRLAPKFATWYSASSRTLTSSWFSISWKMLACRKMSCTA